MRNPMNQNQADNRFNRPVRLPWWRRWLWAFVLESITVLGFLVGLLWGSALGAFIGWALCDFPPQPKPLQMIIIAVTVLGFTVVGVNLTVKAATRLVHWLRGVPLERLNDN
jgi:hypothetical protein